MFSENATLFGSYGRALRRDFSELTCIVTCPEGERPNWKAEFLATLKEASQDIGNVSPQDVQRDVREYRTSKKNKPEITVVAEAAQV